MSAIYLDRLVLSVGGAQDGESPPPTWYRAAQARRGRAPMAQPQAAPPEPPISRVWPWHRVYYGWAVLAAAGIPIPFTTVLIAVGLIVVVSFGAGLYAQWKRSRERLDRAEDPRDR